MPGRLYDGTDKFKMIRGLNTLPVGPILICLSGIDHNDWVFFSNSMSGPSVGGSYDLCDRGLPDAEIYHSMYGRKQALPDLQQHCLCYS